MVPSEEGDVIKSNDDWFVEGSDEEEGTETTKGPYVPWSPDGKDIISMFEQMDKEQVLELRWKCPGRRPPSPEKGDEDNSQGDEEDMYSDEDVKEEETKIPEASEFDFDDFGTDTAHKMTPRRTPGSKSTPKSQKKVASMDNVLNKIRHQQKEKLALKEARRGMSRSPASPARFRLGMTGSPGGGSPRTTITSSTGTPLRTPVTEDLFSPESTCVVNKDTKDLQTLSEVTPSAPEPTPETSTSPAPDPPTTVADVKPND